MPLETLEAGAEGGDSNEGGGAEADAREKAFGVKTADEAEKLPADLALVATKAGCVATRSAVTPN